MSLENVKKFLRREILFCDINPTCYNISMKKEIFKRHLQDFKARPNFATSFSEQTLPNLIDQRQSHLIKRGPGVELNLQLGKAKNIDIAAKTMHRLIIHPGEEFSFWKLVGKISTDKGYEDGRVLYDGRLVAATGGGLCNLANTIHQMVVRSPLEITEFHVHSDALAPDEGPRIPFANGTSVAYNNQDYRFKNTTDQPIQLLIWCQDDVLYGELRSETPFPWVYEVMEEDHHFSKKGEKFYRNSKIYKQTFDRKTNSLLSSELILTNHSEVMYDPQYIPQDLLRP